MCTNKKAPPKKQKTNRILLGMFCNLLKQIFLLFRSCLDMFIDFLFGLYWDGERKFVPNLVKQHHFLTESATSLAKKIRNKELKSGQLVKACIDRIQAVNPILNAMTDERFKDAIAEAQEIDKMIESGLPDEFFDRKPFLGVPFTSKESHGTKGLLYTLGIRSRASIRAQDDAECVRLLKESGAIALAVTNVPEINKWQETRNNVFGMTLNPFHTGRTVGGSSGGEAALMAAMATPISLCSDIGGSTRMPAFYCGLFGHNPTAGTTSLKGSCLRSGLHDTMASISCITRHAEDMAPLTAVLADNMADALKLDHPVDFKDIKFFYMETATDLRISPISSDLRKAMRSVISHLKETGGSAPVPLSPHVGFSHMFALWKYHMVKEHEDFAAMLLNNQGRANGIVELLKKLFGQSDFTGAAILKLLDDQLLPLPRAAWADTTTKALREHLIEALGDSGVLLFPSCSQPAPYHYSAFLRPFNFAYWGIFNALRFPACQVPLGVNSEGIPLGIQVVSSPYNDRLCISVAKHLEKHFGGFQPPCKVNT